MFRETGERAVTTSPSEIAQKKTFIKRFGKAQAKEINEDPTNIKKRDAGVHVHNVAEMLLNYIVYGKGDLAEIEAYAVNEHYKLPKKAFQNLKKGVEEIVKQIKETQEKIDPEGDVIIIPEMVVIDVYKDMGGSIDILALYSDNTASIFDYKTVVPKAEAKTGYGPKAKIIDDFIPAAKEDSFRIQLGLYSEILTRVYGISKIRNNRVIPVHLELANYKTKEDQKKFGYYKEKISALNIGEKQNEHLTQMPVGFEITGENGLDNLIKSNIRLIDTLKKKQENSKKLKKGEWARLQNRIQALRKANNKLITRRDFVDYYAAINDTMEHFYENRDEEEYLEDGSPNPKFLSDKDLEVLLEEAKVFSSIIEDIGTYFPDLAENDKEAHKQLEKLIKENTVKIELFKTAVSDAFMNIALQEINEEDIDPYTGRVKVQTDEGAFKKMFGSLSDFKHPIFKTFKRLVDEVFYKTRQKIQDLEEEVSVVQDNVLAWGKANGLSKTQTWKKLINPETGNLHSKLSREFLDKVNTLRENKDYDAIKELYEIADEAAWQARYEERLAYKKEALKNKHNNLKELKGTDGETVRSASYFKKKYDIELKTWETHNNLLEHDEAWVARPWELIVKPAVAAKNESEGYKYIKANKPLLEFYELFVAKNREFRDILGLGHEDIPNTFVANIRKTFLEKLFRKGGGIQGAYFEFWESLTVREEDEHLGIQDANTGEVKKQIPLLYKNPFKDGDGNINPDEKSYDLGRVLMTFGAMAYNNRYMQEIEGRVHALKHTLAHEEEASEDANSKIMKDTAGQVITKKLGTASSTYQLFDQMSDYFLYRIQFTEKGKNLNIFGTEINSTKAILAAKHFLSAKTLGLGIIPGTAAWLHGRLSARLESKKGIAFNEGHSLNAVKYFATDHKKYLALTKMYDVHVEGYSYKKALKMSKDGLVKWVNGRTLFAPFRVGDTNVDNHILISMSQNYGFDKEGNLRRLKNLPEGTKSIWESTKYNEKTGELFIEGLTESNFIAFRNAVKEISVSTKGARSAEDVSQSDFNLTINVLMHFKTWMPGILQERFRRLEYNEYIDAPQYGRYRAYFSEYEYVQGMGFMTFLKDVVVPNMGKLALDLTTFGLAPTLGMNRVNEARAKRQFEKWKLEYPDKAEKVSYEDFLEVKEAQIKALMSEMRTIILMLSVVAALGADWDGDGEPLYMKFWLLRIFAKIWKRGASEMAFAFSPEEFIRLTKNPLPIATLLVDLQKVTSNTVDEFFDIVTQRDDGRDRTPAFYHSSQFIYGFNQFRRVVEIYEEDKKNMY
jgi:hypothetical protein